MCFFRYPTEKGRYAIDSNRAESRELLFFRKCKDIVEVNLDSGDLRLILVKFRNNSIS